MNIRRVCPVCRLDVPKSFPDVEGHLCPSCYRKNVGTCMVCDAEPVEIIEYHRVYGLVILGFSGAKTLVACKECARRLILKNLVLTAFFGWLGFLPFYKAFRGQRINLRSLFKHPAVDPRWKPLVTLLAFTGPLLMLAGAAALLAALLPGRAEPTPFTEPTSRAEEFRLNGEEELAAGHPDLAEAWFRKSLSEAPWFPPARLGLGTALEGQGKAKEAEEEYRRALEGLDASPYPQLRQSLARLLAKSGRHGEAADVLMPEIGWDSGFSPELIDMHRLFQDSMCRTGKGAQALEIYSARLQKSQDSAAAHYLVGRLEAENPRPGARAFFLAALERDKGFFPAAYALGRLELALGFAGAAKSAFEKALEIRKNDQLAAFSYAEAVLALDGPEAASALLEKMKKDFPSSLLPLIGLAKAANIAGDAETAAERAGHAVSSARGVTAAVANMELGLALGVQGKGKEASLAMDRAMSGLEDRAVLSECSAWAAELAARLEGRDAAALWKAAAGGGGWPGMAGRLWTGAMAEAEYLDFFGAGKMPAWRSHGYYFAGLKRKLSGDPEGAKPLFDKALEGDFGLFRKLIDRG